MSRLIIVTYICMCALAMSAACADAPNDRAAGPDATSDAGTQADSTDTAGASTDATQDVDNSTHPPEACRLETIDTYVSDDSRPSARTTLIYDDRGNLLRKNVDFGVDDTIDRFEYWEYDVDDNMTLRVQYDNDRDQETFRHSFEYDDQGRLVYEALDHDADGRIDMERSQEWEGNLRVGGWEEWEFQQRETLGFEYEGDVLVKETWTDGGFVDQILYEYDVADRLIRFTSRHQSDQTPATVSRIYYDSEGNKSRVTEDRFDDGSIDKQTRFRYNERGLLEAERVFYGIETSPMFETLYAYDEGGKLIERVYLEDGEERWRRTERLYYECELESGQ